MLTISIHIKQKKRFANNGAVSDPIGIPMTRRKILEHTWKKLFFIKNSKQEFIPWRE